MVVLLLFAAILALVQAAYPIQLLRLKIVKPVAVKAAG